LAYLVNNYTRFWGFAKGSQEIEKMLNESQRGSFMLTGGKSAGKLYKILGEVMVNYHFRVDYFFGDERCVSPNAQLSNYGMSVNTLFAKSIPLGCKVERMKGECEDCSKEAERYSTKLPESVDLLLLSVGQDGHIASIFPGNKALAETEKQVVHIDSSPKPPLKRLTVTPKVIKSAKKIIVMATGKRKGKVLAKALVEPYEITQIPVRLTIGFNRVWILDRAATEGFKSVDVENTYNTRIIYA